jgi:O-antigen/teichoic acid export membrane protein
MKKPLQNILAVAGSDVASRLLGFAANAYLARVLGTSGFGIMSIGFSLLGYVAFFSGPGLNTFGTREVAAGADRQHAFANSVNSLRAVLAVALTALTFLIALLFIRPPVAALTTSIFALSALPLAFFFDWYFQGKERLGVSSAAKVVVAIAYLILVLVWVSTEADVVWTGVAFFAANALAAAWLVVMFNRSGGRFSFVWQMNEWRALLRRGVPLGIAGLLAQTFMNMPVLIAGALISTHGAGVLNAAMKLIFAAMIIDRVFYAMFFPIIARHYTLGSEQFFRTSTLALKLVLAVAVPIVVGGVVFADEIVKLVYSEKFAEAALPFRILLLYFFFSVLNTVFMCAMIAENQERRYVQTLSRATILLVVACVILSLATGVVGTASSLAMGEGVLTMLLFIREGKRIISDIVKLLVPSLVAGLLMFGVMIQFLSMSLWAALFAGPIVFVLALLLLRGVSREDLMFLRERFV